MEARFGHDFGRVRVHAERPAAEAAAALSARGFTVGADIYFAAGRYAPGTASGRALLAHELTHTLQQARGAVTVQRAPAADPVCDAFELEAATEALSAAATGFIDTPKTAERLAVIQAAKPIRRCASPAEQETARSDLVASLGKKGKAIWDEAGTPLGGYTGMFPSYAIDVGSKLRGLGASELVTTGQFSLSASPSAHRRGARKVAKRLADRLARTDVVYFRGHQFAQYLAPGVFSDDDENRAFDLRYVAKAGGFTNVRLMVATSCATLCAEAFAVFHGLFPNATLLGYRKGTRIRGGEGVRRELGRKIRALRRPLMLEEQVDVQAIISAWESVVESRHKGERSLLPAHFSGGVLRFWDGAAWHTMDPTDAANACERHGVHSDQKPGPPE